MVGKIGWPNRIDKISFVTTTLLPQGRTGNGYPGPPVGTLCLSSVYICKAGDVIKFCSHSLYILLYICTVMFILLLFVNHMLLHHILDFEASCIV